MAFNVSCCSGSIVVWSVREPTTIVNWLLNFFSCRMHFRDFIIYIIDISYSSLPACLLYLLLVVDFIFNILINLFCEFLCVVSLNSTSSTFNFTIIHFISSTIKIMQIIARCVFLLHCLSTINYVCDVGSDYSIYSNYFTKRNISIKWEKL